MRLWCPQSLLIYISRALVYKQSQARKRTTNKQKSHDKSRDEKNRERERDKTPTLLNQPTAASTSARCSLVHMLRRIYVLNTKSHTVRPTQEENLTKCSNISQ